jgi:CO/xanthine dehydrogenase Mo-binding subunit
LPLESEKVRYIGDEIAAVAAVDEDTAREALDLIRVDFEELPGLFDPVEAMKPGALAIHDSVENNISRAINMECGNVEEGFAKADLILEDTLRTERSNHNLDKFTGPSSKSSEAVSCVGYRCLKDSCNHALRGWRIRQ